MSRPAEPHREVQRYAYLIIVTIVVAAAALFASMYLRYASESRARNRLELFHLRSIMLTDLGSKQVSEVQQALLRDQGEAEPALSRKISIAFDAVGRNLDFLIELQEERGTEEFAGTIARIEERFERLQQLRTDGDPTSSAFSQQLDSVGFALFQLNRLHSISAERSLEKIEDRSRRRARDLVFVSFGVLIVAGILVGRFVYLLNTSLREHRRVHEALLESERQVQHASKMQALGTLVGGVAHDFNNILTAILGYSEALEERMRGDDRARVMVGEIQKAGKRAATLTRHLLAFSRQDRVEARVVDVNSMLRELEPLLRRLIREDIDLVVQCTAEPCPAEIDVVQFEQVLVNLAVNARDAMPGGGTLAFRTESLFVVDKDPKIPGGHYVRISVEDTGCGMDPAVRARVFEPFFTTKAPDRGTGLGLSTVHGIVTKSQGFIFVESETGAGSTFDIYLPRYDKAPETGRAEERISGSTEGNETVLVVEDEAPVRDVVTAALRSAGYDVVSASEGMEALRICAEREGSIDLLLTDVVMPLLGGPELARRARELHPDLRVVFFTGYVEEAALEELDDFDVPVVSKPFQAHELLVLIRRTLDERRSAEGSNVGA